MSLRPEHAPGSVVSSCRVRLWPGTQPCRSRQAAKATQWLPPMPTTPGESAVGLCSFSDETEPGGLAGVAVQPTT